MKLIGPRMFVVEKIGRRVAAIICFALAVAIVQLVRNADHQVTGHILVHLPPESETPEQHRNLSEYDLFGEPVEDCSWMEGLERRQCLNTARNARKFIYDHWVARKKAYIEIRGYCIDCFPEDHLFIEPDQDGNWKVFVRSFIPYSGYSFQRSFTNSIEIGVKIRPATKYERKRLGTKEVLVFLDSHGQEIGLL